MRKIGTFRIRPAGKDTRIVTLDITWCRMYNINVGDSVDQLIMEDGSLLIKPTVKPSAS